MTSTERPIFTVEVWINVDPDGCNFLGYRPEHPLARVATFRVSADDDHAALELIWAVGNKMRLDLDGAAYPHDVRSLSVGDVAVITTDDTLGSPYACDSVGWRQLDELRNPRVPLAGAEPHTSRPAGSDVNAPTPGTLRVLYVPVNGEPETREIDPERDYRQIRELLGGGWLEAITGDVWAAYLDEEGKIKHLPINRLATALARALHWPGSERDVLVGPVVFVGPPDADGENTSVPTRLIDVLNVVMISRGGEF